MKNKINKFMHSKIFIVILILLLITLVSITGTYAWFTWNSTENTRLTMTIGRFADVVFTSGNDITTELTPVFNYYDGEKTTFNINNRDTSGTSIKSIIKLNITTISSELRSKSVKYSLEKNGELVATGNLSTAYDNASIDVYFDALSSGTTSYTFYLYIDGNVENDSSMMNKTIVGNLTVEAMEPISYNDFTYYLGSEHPTIDTIDNYYDKVMDAYYDIPIATIKLDPTEVLLFKYNGESEDVYVPNTYTINNVTYDVILLSDIYLSNDDVDTHLGVFKDNKYIKNVYFEDNVKFIADMDSGSIFENSAYMLFSGCGNLVSVFGVPNTIIYMDFTFANCTSLVNAPVIPSSVTSMTSTFQGCTSLVNAPKIPDTVTNMTATFQGCTNLVNAPEIPNSVTSLTVTFNGCTNLTGTVRINSNNVTSTAVMFHGTTKPIIVEVSSGSTTYTTINGTLPSNVTLRTFDAS